MAGTVGFEPTDHGIKTRCLTAWPRPNFKKEARIINKDFLQVKIFDFNAFKI